MSHGEQMLRKRSLKTLLTRIWKSRMELKRVKKMNIRDMWGSVFVISSSQRQSTDEDRKPITNLYTRSCEKADKKLRNWLKRNWFNRLDSQLMKCLVNTNFINLAWILFQMQILLIVSSILVAIIPAKNDLREMSSDQKENNVNSVS